MLNRIWVNHLGITSHPDRLSLSSFRGRCRGKGVRITSVGWQVTLCDPIMTTNALDIF